MHADGYTGYGIGGREPPGLDCRRGVPQPSSRELDRGGREAACAALSARRRNVGGRASPSPLRSRYRRPTSTQAAFMRARAVLKRTGRRRLLERPAASYQRSAELRKTDACRLYGGVRPFRERLRV